MFDRVPPDIGAAFARKSGSRLGRRVRASTHATRTLASTNRASYVSAPPAPR
jgi:hypothetical protein